MLASAPKKTLLATDLSGRPDRALDRATQLAVQWNAERTIVQALEGAKPRLARVSRAAAWRLD